jgi:hypothetical protein
MHSTVSLRHAQIVSLRMRFVQLQIPAEVQLRQAHDHQAQNVQESVYLQPLSTITCFCLVVATGKKLLVLSFFNKNKTSKLFLG